MVHADLRLNTGQGGRDMCVLTRKKELSYRYIKKIFGLDSLVWSPGYGPDVCGPVHLQGGEGSTAYGNQTPKDKAGKLTSYWLKGAGGDQWAYVYVHV